MAEKALRLGAVRLLCAIALNTLMSGDCPKYYNESLTGSVVASLEFSFMSF
jgi:hypothetical protein